jgi:hypothetical protein
MLALSTASVATGNDETYLCGSIKHTSSARIDGMPACISLHRDSAGNIYHCDDRTSSAGARKRTLIPITFDTGSKELLNFASFYRAVKSYFDFACDVTGSLSIDNGVQRMQVTRINGCVDTMVAPILVGDFKLEFDRQLRESNGMIKSDQWAKNNQTHKKLVRCQDDIVEAKEFYGLSSSNDSNPLRQDQPAKLAPGR